MKKNYSPRFVFFLLALLFSIRLLAQVPANVTTITGLDGPSGSAANRLNGPRGLCLDNQGNIYVADHVNRRVQKFLPGNENGTTAAPLSSTLETTPTDVFVDDDGAMYVSDDLGSRILKYTPGEPEGKVIIQAAPAPGEFRGVTFNAPYGIFVDKAKNVYVTDGTERGVIKFAPSPDIIFTPGQKVSPSNMSGTFQDVFMDASGYMYASDVANHRVIKFTPGAADGVVVAGGNGAGNLLNQLNTPKGIYVDLAGNVFVADFYNNRIMKWAPGANTGITVAGAIVVGNQLNLPWGVELDKAGNIYVSDNGGNRIQKFAVTTGLDYKYYEGTFTSLPNFNTIVPIKAGLTLDADINYRKVISDNFAFLWEGYLKITTPGTYTFETLSDDGSKFYFNTRYSPTATALVNNDGVHAATSATGTVYVAEAGIYPIAISYFEKDGGQQMTTYWTGPGIARQKIPAVLFSQIAPATPPPVAAGALSYKYYEGGFNLMPDFSTLTPLKTGTSTNFDISIHRRALPIVSLSYGMALSTYQQRATILLKPSPTMAASCSLTMRCL